MEGNVPYGTRSRQVPTSALRKPSELADSTSDFRPKDLMALNIVYTNSNESNPTSSSFDQSLMIKEMDKNQLLYMWDNESMGSHLNSKQRTLAEHVSKVLVQELASAGKREKSTDAFVNFLLSALEFNLFPLSLELKPDCYFKVHNKTVTSESDFGIYKKRLFAIVDEDKHIHNVLSLILVSELCSDTKEGYEHSTGWGECQIAGEILAATYSNHHSISKRYKQQTIYAIRVIGTRFTFYKAEVPYDYIESLADGFPEDKMLIYRHPPWDGSPGTDNIPCLDYSNSNQRRTILSLMATLRDRVISEDVAK